MFFLIWRITDLERITSLFSLDRTRITCVSIHVLILVNFKFGGRAIFLQNAEHLWNLEEVLRWLQEHGVKLHKEKCLFFSGVSGIPGPLYGQSRHPHLRKKGEDHFVCLFSSQLAAAKVLSGAFELLC